MKPVCFIAARGGSKGVKNKNTRLFAGKPLISYAIEQSIKSKIFSHVIVSTEDKKIISIAKKYGAEVPFIRPKKWLLINLVCLKCYYMVFMNYNLLGMILQQL